MNETWGSWCDIPGANCWKFDGNESGCNVNNNTCQWTTGFGYCDVNQTVANSCLGLNNASCSTNANCTWISDPWCTKQGGWCEGDFSLNCWNATSLGVCGAKSGCTWTADPWCVNQTTNGWCEYKGFACWQYYNESGCTQNSCKWFNDTYSPQGGWCGSTCFAPNFDQSSCQTAGCVWKSGFCNPKGFGGKDIDGGGFGLSCYKFNGNQTACINQTGCSFFSESSPFCDIEFSADCHQYSNSTNCNNATLTGGKCKWNTNGNFCEQSVFECFWNSSLQNQSACPQNSLCSWSGFNCEPKCFNATVNKNQTACQQQSGCTWASGWCEPATMAAHFDTAEQGEPQILGFDPCGPGTSDTNISAWVDICGFGMKDMGDAYGFGIKVYNFNQSAICNSLSLQGGGTGTGNESTRYYFYLDTDGKTAGGCSTHNTSLAGFEFYFRHESNLTKGVVSETYTAHKCVDGQWGVAAIALSGDKRMMCSDIGGPIIAIDKDDLQQFQNLYTGGVDLRIYVSSADKAGDINKPSDTASPGYATPGSIDFKAECCWDVGSDCDADGIFAGSDPDCSDINRKGFVQYEECFSNGIDEDEDNTTDCFDLDCKFFQYCVDNQLGVNAPGYTDKTAPKVIAIKTEEYLDSALIAYDTNEPANGTLLFYRNDSSCLTLSSAIYDAGINLSNVRKHKTWLVGELYNDSGVYSLNYNLSLNTTYYYKLKVCDPAGNCGTSACLNFKLPTADKCGFCNFTTRLKAPPGWTVSYDIDQNGAYEHVQGQVCGQNAGMKTNYTEGRRVNIRLSFNDSITIVDFFNITLTKSFLNDKVRTFSDFDDVKGGTTTDSAGGTVYYTGIESEVRDQIINNLHPQRCRIVIPGTSNELWQCDDSFKNCQQRSDATLVNSTSNSRTWEIPFCEFSVWASSRPGTPPGGSSGGSSGGGGGGGGFFAPLSNKTNQTIVTEKPSAPVCGNSLCESGERISCPQDCPGVSAVCTPGDRVCSGDNLQECSPAGNAWLTVETCVYGCENNACKQAPAEAPALDYTFLLTIIAIVSGIIIVGSVYIRKKNIV